MRRKKGVGKWQENSLSFVFQYSYEAGRVLGVKSKSVVASFFLMSFITPTLLLTWFIFLRVFLLLLPSSLFFGVCGVDCGWIRTPLKNKNKNQRL